MLRKSAVLLAALLCSVASQVYALGLGNVTVESYLNQPLRVRIEVLQLGDTRLEDVSVQMASVDNFARFNIERVGFLSEVRFRVETTAGGNYVVLTSNQVVREPYLSFILETRWPNGRLLSEHTILLDLPVFEDQAPTAAEVRQPISPVLREPDNADQTAAPSTGAAPTPSLPAAPVPSVAPVLEPEIIAPTEPEQESTTESVAVEEQEQEPETEPTATQPSPEPVPEAIVADVDADAVETVEEIVEQNTPEEESVTDTEQAEPTEEVAVVDDEAQEDSADQDAVAAEADAAPDADDSAADLVAEEVEVAAEPPVPEPRTIETSDADTLLDIAQQVRPDASVTLQQTMLAIQALNPDAFIDDNINRMRSGQVLRVPNREEIEATDASTAASEVVRQNQAFADLQPLAAPAQDEPDTQAAPQGQLSVITAEDAAIDATSGAGELDDEQNAELDRRIAELENQLALRQEEADRARIEREELDSRLADLEAQIEASQEIIRLQDMQLAQLQESLAEAAAEAEVIAAEEAALAAAQAEIDAAQAQPATGASLVNDIMRILTGNTMIMLFGVALVILLLVGLLLRRNRAAANDEEDELEGLDQQDFAADREQGAAADAGLEQAIENKAEADENDLDQELDDILGSGSSETEMLTETGDAAGTEKGIVADANALIQQQKYGQAASLLRQALEADPADHDARLKLAEALALQDDLAAFEEQADIIAEERSPILDREVSNLREKLSASSAATASEAPGAEESEDDAGIDFEGFGDAEDAAEKLVEEPADSPEESKQDDDTASFLDDLGIDLDAFDADDFEFSDEIAEAGDDSDQPAADEIDDDQASLDAELDMTFDLGAIAELEDSEEQQDEQQEEQQEEPQEEQQIDELSDEEPDSTGPADLKTDDEISPLDEPDEGIDGAASDKADDETIIEFDEESSEEQETLESDSQDDKSESLEKDGDTVLDLDAESENAELTSGSAKEVDDLDIDAFEFDADDFKTVDNSGEDSQAETKEDELDLETFSFDTEDIPKPAPTAETAPLAADDENALDFDFDKAEIKRDSEADSSDEPEEIETFEFDGEPAESESNVDDGSATADESDATEIDIDEVSFDIGEEIEAEEGREAGSAADSDDDEFDFDLDAELEASTGSGDPVEEKGSEVELLFDDESDSGENTESGTETSVSADQDIEIDLDFDESPEVEGVAEKTENAEEDDLDDLGFLSDDDEVEIESVDGVEEVSLMSDDDETATKLELAYAYQKMGDADGAREILQEVIAEGNEAQVKEAGELLASLDDAD